MHIAQLLIYKIFISQILTIFSFSWAHTQLHQQFEAGLGLVAQSVMSATLDNFCGLSTKDPRLRQWISICTMVKDVGMPLWPVLV